MKARTLYWISSIIGGIFIIVALILRSLGKIQLGVLITTSIIVLIVAIAINVLFWYVHSKKEISEIADSKLKVVSPEVAEAKAKELLMEKHFEYPREEEFHKVGEKGDRNTPVLSKLYRGEFEGKLYGIAVNMFDINRNSIVEYDDSQMDINKIKEELEMQANDVAFAPRPDKLFKTRKSYDPLTGRTIEEKEPIGTESKESKEGGLK